MSRAVVPPRNTLIKRCQKWKQAVVIGVLRREAHEPLQIGPDKIFRGKNECNVVNPFAGGFRRCIASTCARISRKSIHFPSDGSQLSHSWRPSLPPNLSAKNPRNVGRDGSALLFASEIFYSIGVRWRNLVLQDG